MGTQEHGYTGAWVYSTGAWVHRSMGTQEHGYTGAWVHRSMGIKKVQCYSSAVMIMYFRVCSCFMFAV